MTIPSAETGSIRPRLHFTAEQGWLNDPHGICWLNGAYHLFFQHNPAGREWSSAVHWGHAVSADLVRWRHLPIALSPRADEEGCWSGSAVIEDGRPTLFYTSVRAGNWNRGRVALAFPDAELLHWESSEDDVVVDGPPADIGAYAFRDPCIFATDDGWTMVVGVGVEGGTGLAVQYRSTDRRAWTYAGVICSRSGDETAGVWTGGLWECPQLFRVGDDWALVVSVWDDDKLHYVASALGSYDGTTFTPERWSRLTHDDIAYAMTSFVDNAGRPCVLFWLREEADHDPDSRPWAGALSLPMVAEIGPDRTLRLRPHPDVDTLRDPVAVVDGPLAEQVRVPDATQGLDVEVSVSAGFAVALADSTGVLLTIKADPAAPSLLVEVTDKAPATVAVVSDAIRMIIDTGIVELFAGDGSAAFRIPVRGAADLTISGGSTTGHLTVYRLAPAV